MSSKEKSWDTSYCRVTSEKTVGKVETDSLVRQEEPQQHVESRKNQEMKGFQLTWGSKSNAVEWKLGVLTF